MLIKIIKANEQHVEGISKVCSESYWATYGETHTTEYIERVVKEFYNHDRIMGEVTHSDRHWGGYFVAVEEDEVIGAAGGGMTDEDTGEIFVLYLDPKRRNEGIGTKLLEAVTKQQKEEFSAVKQWVSVQNGNRKGIPFYEAKGFEFQHEKDGHGNTEQDSYRSLRYCRNI